MDALNWSKMTVKTFIMFIMKKIQGSHKILNSIVVNIVKENTFFLSSKSAY